MSKSLNYNTDAVKHYVRYNGWVNSFRTIKNYVDRQIRLERRTAKCKYLTFCAVQAIDIFMLELKHYIYRDRETSRLTNVFFCENDEESFSLINKMIGSEGQGFFGDFKDIVLQNLDEEVEDPADPFDEPASVEDREKLRLKDVKRNILQVFPFDVINLDFYGNFFPKSQQRFSDSCQTYNEVLKLQKLNNGHSCSRFLMFLTVYTPVLEGQINPDAIRLFDRTLQQNMAYDRFREAFARKYQIASPKDLDLYLKFVLGFTKQIIFRETFKLGWKPTLREIYCYDRTKPATGEPYKISTFVVEYNRDEALDLVDFAGEIPEQVEEDYLQQLELLINDKPHIVPVDDQVPDEIKQDLGEIVAFRNEFLKQIGIYDEQKFG